MEQALDQELICSGLLQSYLQKLLEGEAGKS